MGTGAIAFTHIWATDTNSMVDPAQSEFADVIKFAPAAAPKPGGLLAGSAWNDDYSIPATTTLDPDLVFRVIMEVADTQSMQAAASVGIVTRTVFASRQYSTAFSNCSISSRAKGSTGASSNLGAGTDVMGFGKPNSPLAHR